MLENDCEDLELLENVESYLKESTFNGLLSLVYRIYYRCVANTKI